MATITIDLGTANNPEQTISELNKVKFHNTTNVSITLTTPQGMNPQGDTVIASGATKTQNGFTISANPGAQLGYTWKDTDSAALATRSGTIRVS